MREQILGIACDLKEGSISLNEAKERLISLLESDKYKSFVCNHPPKQTYLLNGIWHCEKCLGKWEQ